MGCGESFVKYLLFIVNFIFAVAGIALLSIGIVVKFKISGVTDHIDVTNVNIAPYTAITLGTLIFLIAFLGCCGAITENRCMLISFAIILGLLMIISAAIGIAIFVKKTDVQEGVTEALEKLFREKRAQFYELQKAVECCGTTGPLSYPIEEQLSLPKSCCAEDSSVCTTVNAYEGCATKFNNLLNKYAPTIAAIFIATAAAMLVSVVYACCLSNHVKNKQHYHY